MNRKLRLWLARYGIPLTIAVVLIAGFRLYLFTYFWLDDFNNVYWIRREGFWSLLWHIVNPVSLFFRPLGMLVYWIVWRMAGMNPLPYHLLSWILHAVNTGLVFLLLRRATGSQYAAGLAVLFFAFRTNFGDIYWSFANIFQLLAFALFLVGMLLYMRFGYSIKETLILLGIAVLAIRAEEQGVLLPILWFAYEVLVRRGLTWRRFLMRFVPFGAVMLFFTLFKISTMHDVDPTRPYYMDLSVLTFGRGYGWYFNSLYHTDLRWGAWFIISAVLTILFLIFKNRWALFFLLFTYATLGPYVFLINHRYELYSYMACAGIAGLLALGIKSIQTGIHKLMPARTAAVVLSLLFVVVAQRNFRYEDRRGRDARAYTKGLAEEYRNYLSDLQALPDAATVPILYFVSTPRHMDDGNVLCSAEFALNRTNIDAKIVPNCPAEGACVEFKDGRLRRLH